MNQPDLTKLVSKLRIKINDRRNLKNVLGPEGRHNKIRKTVTALFKYERIELNYGRADEARGYAERLISDAIRNGECHKETMEMANYWLIEKPMVHKLFKVLAPRYQNSSLSYTKMWRAPRPFPGHVDSRCILELRNNIYPSLEPDKRNNKNLIHNVLLQEAKKIYEKEKAMKSMKETSSPKMTVTKNVNEELELSKSSDKLNETTVAKSIEMLPDEDNGVSDSISHDAVKSDEMKAESVDKDSISKDNDTDSEAYKDLDLDKVKVSDIEKDSKK